MIPSSSSLSPWAAAGIASMANAIIIASARASSLFVRFICVSSNYDRMLIQRLVDLVFRGAADSRRIPYSSRFVHDVSGKFKTCLKRHVRTVDISQIMGHNSKKWHISQLKAKKIKGET